MKNSRLIAILLAAVFVINCVPIQAVEQKSCLSTVKKQLNESLDRFKRCMRGKCTRSEKIKVARDVGIAAAAVLALVGGGYLAWAAFARRKHSMPRKQENLTHVQTADGRVLPKGTQRTMTNEEFSRINLGKLPSEAQDYLRAAFTQGDDDALALFWILRSGGGGRSIISGHFGNLLKLDSPLLAAADRMQYDIAKNILMLAVSSGERNESTDLLIRMIMTKKGNEPFFQIAYLFAQIGWFSAVLPSLTVDDASSETQRILQSVHGPSQINRLEHNIKRLLAVVPNWQGLKPDSKHRAIIKELDQWVKTCQR